MKVYIVIAGWHYETTSIAGVYSSKELAEIKKKEMEAEKTYDFVKISEWEIETE